MEISIVRINLEKTYFSRNKESIMLNRTVGHLLRSKLQGTDEGGIVAGFGALDSPLLYEEVN